MDVIQDSSLMETENADARTYEKIVLTLVVPVFNESETVSLFMERVKKVFDEFDWIGLDVVFVNDGSTDNTLERLLELKKPLQKYSNSRLKSKFWKRSCSYCRSKNSLWSCRGSN